MFRVTCLLLLLYAAINISHRPEVEELLKRLQEAREAGLTAKQSRYILIQQFNAWKQAQPRNVAAIQEAIQLSELAGLLREGSKQNRFKDKLLDLGRIMPLEIDQTDPSGGNLDNHARRLLA